MKFSLLVSADPTQSVTAEQAYQFSKAALASGHEVYRIFFYQAGTLAADAKLLIGDTNLAEQWAKLSAQKSLELCLCPASAERHGLTDASAHKSASLPHPAFVFGGLAQLVDAYQQSDRVVSFC